jgi:hypothetical protein
VLVLAQLFVLVLVAHLTAEEETVNGGQRTPSPGDTAASGRPPPEQREVGGGILGQRPLPGDCRYVPIISPSPYAES